MHHTLDAKVLHVGKPTRHLVRDVQPQLRAANYGIATRVLEWRVLVERYHQGASADELAVTNQGVAVLAFDDACIDGQIVFVDIQALSRLAQQSAACGSGGKPDLHPAVLDR